MADRITKILDVLDTGLQSSPESDMYRDVAPIVHDGCTRCRGVQAEDSEFCAGCRSFLLGDSDVDPTAPRNQFETFREQFPSGEFVRVWTRSEFGEYEMVEEVSSEGYERAPRLLIGAAGSGIYGNPELADVVCDAADVLSQTSVVLREIMAKFQAFVSSPEFVEALRRWGEDATRVSESFGAALGEWATEHASPVDTVDTVEWAPMPPPRRRVSVCPLHGLVLRSGGCAVCQREIARRGR